jgi:hypothetical protein
MPAAAEGSTLPEATQKVRGRRRRILIHEQYQLRTAIRGAVGMTFLVALMIFILHRINLENTRDLLELAPFLRESLQRRDGIQLWALIGGGALFVSGMFLIDLLESHRTAGALYNLRRRLEDLRCGRYGAQMKLRKHDQFPELETVFNNAMASLRARTEGEVATLARMAGQLEDLLREVGQGNQARVRLLAETLLQGVEEQKRRKGELLGGGRP